MKKCMVAMSGGVDSSVTAYLLSKQGIECCGCTMKLYDNGILADGNGKTCCSLDDVEDARSVAFKLGMKYHVFNYMEAFEDCVIKDFVSCYRCGKTPNPCIVCNKYMKFDKLLNQALVLGYDGIATGHYAVIENDNNIYRLKKAVDLSKDQSYVLYSLNQFQLEHILFPLGGLTKIQVREIAEANGFVNAHKHDSQDICFVPDGDYAGMIERYTGDTFKSGYFLDKEGNVLGEHKGIINYTLGQRRGLGIPAADRLYVVKLDMENNNVILGANEDLFTKKFKIKEFHYIEGDNIPDTIKCKVKIRYKHTEQPAIVHYMGEGIAEIEFMEAQRAITPGQTAVLYQDEYVLGGGIIC